MKCWVGSPQLFWRRSSRRAGLGCSRLGDEDLSPPVSFFVFPVRIRGLCLFWGLLWPALACSPVSAGDSINLWPLYGRHRDPLTGATETRVLGPLILRRESPEGVEGGFRPLFYTVDRPAEHSRESEVLYPLGSYTRQGTEWSFRFFPIFYERHPAEFTFFPLLFSRGPGPEEPGDFGLFPLWGHLRGRFGRDEIRFVLFPLYARTRKEEVESTHVLWPFFSRWTGPGQRGWQVWPLYGRDRAAGRFDKTFALWPIYFREDLDLDTPHPTRVRYVLPFYASRISAERRQVSVLWPLFTKISDSQKGIEQWDGPWPLVHTRRGPEEESFRVWPLYGRSRIGERERKFVLWPVYTFQAERLPEAISTRHRFLLFLYQDRRLLEGGEALVERHRVDVWPLFSFVEGPEGTYFHFLSILEPFFPENERIARNYSPLWRLYVVRRDREGRLVSNLLWNLYRREVTPEGHRIEFLGPLFLYNKGRGEGGERTRVSLLRGLLEYRREAGARSLRLLYLLAIPLGGGAEEPNSQGRDDVQADWWSAGGVLASDG